VGSRAAGIAELRIHCPAPQIRKLIEVSYWDALILHAAESCGAAVLYSEDLALASGQRYGAVEVVNPLRA
jgi:predicted nucleic acid-binding protein